MTVPYLPLPPFSETCVPCPPCTRRLLPTYIPLTRPVLVVIPLLLLVTQVGGGGLFPVHDCLPLPALLPTQPSRDFVMFITMCFVFVCSSRTIVPVCLGGGAVGGAWGQAYPTTTSLPPPLHTYLSQAWGGGVGVVGHSMC